MPQYSDDYIKSILRSSKVIAMFGASGISCVVTQADNIDAATASVATRTNLDIDSPESQITSRGRYLAGCAATRIPAAVPERPWIAVHFHRAAVARRGAASILRDARRR